MTIIIIIINIDKNNDQNNFNKINFDDDNYKR